MEPLVCIIPQSLRVLVERLPAYVDFLVSEGFGIYQQTSTTLTAQQAATLYSRTQDELFTSNTPVAVLLLERQEPYSHFNGLREQLDIVYGSKDRHTAMQDIHTFFATDSDEEEEEEEQQLQTPLPAAPTTPPPDVVVEPPPPPPKEERSIPPPPPMDDDTAPPPPPPEPLQAEYDSPTPTQHTTALPPPPSEPLPTEDGSQSAVEEAVAPPRPPPSEPLPTEDDSPTPLPASEEETTAEAEEVVEATTEPLLPAPPAPLESPTASSLMPNPPAEDDTSTPPPPTEAEAEGSQSDPAPALPAHFQWEEIEPTQVQLPPSSPSPLPSSPSPPLSPIAFHPAPDSAITSPVYHTHTATPADQPLTPLTPHDYASPHAPPNTATLHTAAHLLRSQTSPTPPTSVPHPSHSPTPHQADSPLAHPDAKRASLTTSSLPHPHPHPPSTTTTKGPSDLLSLPSRLSIKERLAALNLSDTPASAAASAQAHPPREPVVRMEVDEGRRAGMKEKQDRLNEVLGRGRRGSMEGGRKAGGGKGEGGGPRLASVEALREAGASVQSPKRERGSDEWREGLPSGAELMGQECLHGVVHHMTGDEEEWGVRYAILHHDSLYLLASPDPQSSVSVMLLLSAPSVAIAYAEGVVEVRGEYNRHLFAAEMEEIDRWHAAMNRAKIVYAVEERGSVGGGGVGEEEVVKGVKDSPQAVALAAALMGRSPVASHHSLSVSVSRVSDDSPPPSVQEEIRQMKANKGVAGVAAARPASPLPEQECKVGTGQSSPVLLSIQPSNTHPSLLPLTVPPTSSPTPSPPAPSEDATYLRSLLLHGAEFKKYRHRRAKVRWLWCSPALDRLYWGEVKGRKVKGFLMGVDMCSVAGGCAGVKRVECGMTVIGKERTLELEAADEEQKAQWIRAISLLINLNAHK